MRVFAVILLLSLPSLSFTLPQWEPLRVDTITTGDCDDRNPVVHHSSFGWYVDRNRWLVFERRTSDSSMIAALPFLINLNRWDTAAVILSATARDADQRHPDYAEEDVIYGDTLNLLRREGIAVWEQQTAGDCNLWYSILRSDRASASLPVPITIDTLANTSPRVCPAGDSTFLVVWKRGRNLLWTTIRESTIAPPETAGCAPSDAIEFDLRNQWSGLFLVWTARDTGAASLVCRRAISLWPSVAFSPPETLRTSLNLGSPCLSSAAPFVLFEGRSGLHTRICGAELYFPDTLIIQDVTGDTAADYVNPHEFTSPVVTSPPGRRGWPWYYDVITYERRAAEESSLVISMLHFASADTIRSRGVNGAACIGSYPLWASSYWYYAPVVWESNRSGRYHIYGTTVQISSMGVDDRASEPEEIALQQNYPNPFNGTTTIRYRVQRTAMVRMEVVDLLGRRVAVLVNDTRESGEHAVIWNAAGTSSGVYFLLLRVGGSVAVRRMLFLR